MRLFPVALLALSGALAAQTPVTNEFSLYPGATTFTSRSGVTGGNAGRVTALVGNKWFRGAGNQTATDGNLRGYRAVLQDQNAGSRETCSFSVLGANAAGDRPNPTDVKNTGPTFQLPAGPNSPRAWQITQTLQTAANVLPTDKSFAMSANVPANSAWTRDGVSVHAASYTSGSSGDNPRAGTATVTYGINLPANTITAGSVRVHRIGILTEAAVMNTGADIVSTSRRGPNPNYGVAGYSPDTSTRKDGTTFRVRSAGPTGRVAVVGLAGGFSPAGIPLPGFSGRIWIDVATLAIIAQAPVPANGTATIAPSFMAQGQINVVGGIAYQGAVVNLSAGSGEFTNAELVDYK